MHERFEHISAEEWLRRYPNGNKRASYVPGLDQTVVIVPVISEAVQIPYDQLKADEVLAAAAEEARQHLHLTPGQMKTLRRE